MIKRSYFNDGKTCRVTFRYRPNEDVNTVHLVTDLDGWDTSARPMVRRKDGYFSTSLTLSQGGRVQFRYVVNGQRWVNDDHADEHVQNEYGESNSVVNV